MTALQPLSLSSAASQAAFLADATPAIKKTDALGKKILEGKTPVKGKIWRYVYPIKTSIAMIWSVRRLILSIKRVVEKLKKAQVTKEDKETKKAFFVLLINSYDLFERVVKIGRDLVDRHLVDLTAHPYLSCTQLALILASVKFGKASMKLYRYAKLQEKTIHKIPQTEEERKKLEVKKFYYYIKIVRHVANLALGIFMLLAIIFKVASPAMALVVLYAVATGLKYISYPLQWGMWGCKHYSVHGWKKAREV